MWRGAGIDRPLPYPGSRDCAAGEGSVGEEKSMVRSVLREWFARAGEFVRPAEAERGLHFHLAPSGVWVGLRCHRPRD